MKRFLCLLVGAMFAFHLEADVVASLEQFNEAEDQPSMLRHAVTFFNELQGYDFFDYSSDFDRTTPVDTLREQVWYWAAEYFYDRQDYESSEQYGRKALPLFRMGNDRSGEADCLNILAIANVRLSDYEEALDFAQQCYKLDEQSGDMDRVASSLNTLAAIYMSAYQPEGAEQFILRGIEMAKVASNDSRRAVLLGMASEVYHALLDGCDGGVLGEDTALEIVDQDVLPLLDGAADDLGQRSLGLTRCDALVGLARGYEIVGLDEQQVFPFERERQGGEYVSDACGQHGTTADKEGAVGSEGSEQFFHLCLRQPQMELRVEHLHHGGGIAASASKTSPRGNVLLETYGKRRNGKSLVAQQVHNLHHQVVVGGSGYGNSLHGKVVFTVRTYLQCVADRNGVKYGFEVVVPVGTTFGDVEPEVYFGASCRFHTAKLLKNE